MLMGMRGSALSSIGILPWVIAFLSGLASCVSTSSQSAPSTTTAAGVSSAFVSTAESKSSAGTFDETRSSGSGQLNSSFGDLHGFVDPKVKCAPNGLGFHWQKSLKATGLDPQARALVVRRQGGILLAGSLRHNPWLGAVSSRGGLVASQEFPLGPSNTPSISSLSQNARGDIAMAGGIVTDAIDITEPVGLWIRTGRLDPGHWSVQGLDGRVDSLISVPQSESVYVLGHRHKAPVQDGSPLGDAYSYVARICPQ